MSESDLKQQIGIAAYFLAQKNIPFDTLCWMLAERQLYVQNNFQKVAEAYIRQKAAEIYLSDPAYDILCWLISEIDLYLKKTLKGKLKPHFLL
jgi:hypothetical protein